MSSPPRYFVYLALFALGLHAQIAQALLIRESLVVFYGNDITLGVFFGSWLLWVAAGSASVVWLRRRHWIQHPLALVSGLLAALPVLLVLQVLATRSVRLFLAVPASELIPLGDLVVALLLITLPTSLAVGLAFPLACKALSDEEPPPSATTATAGSRVGGVSRLYIIDALGALLGGVLFTFVLIEWLGVWRSLGIVAALMGGIAAVLHRRGGVLRLTAWSLVLAGLALAATPLGATVAESMERLRFALLQPGLELLDTVETRYGHVNIARFGTQISVIRDGRITDSFPDPEDVQQQAAYYTAQAPGAERVLVFGGLASGLVTELLRYPLKQVEVIVEDRRAFERVQPYLPANSRAALQDPRLTVHFQDGRSYVHHASRRDPFDLVLVVSADPSSAHSNRYFTREFYLAVSRRMAADGVLCTTVSSAANYLGREVRSYSGSVFHTLSSVLPHLAVAPGDRHVYCAAATDGRVTEDPSILEQRYLAVPLDEHRFPALSFYTLLPASRVAFVREQLAAELAEINTDSRPVSYYLNMLLWGKYSGSLVVDWLQTLHQLGSLPYLVPLLVFVVLLLLKTALENTAPLRLRRQVATLSLVVLGMIAMAMQLALLLSYQAQVGFVFSRIALLNGLFMTGLALGAGLLGRRLARCRRPGIALSGLLLLVALVLATLPVLIAWLGQLQALEQEAWYLLLCLLAGLLTGVGFPLAFHQAQADTGEVLRSSGLIAAADDLGGAMGGLLTGALLVPLLGIPGSCYLLALSAAIALVPVLYAEYAPHRIAGLQLRGYRSFPWAPLSWSLIFIVVTVLILSLLVQGIQPEPRTRFSAATLAQLSGSQHFELSESPVTHYLGSAADGSATDTVSLATITVAKHIRGYGGPLNLLVAVDDSGILRGVRYLESEETPSYIAAIDSWLAGLTGHDFRRSPLGLDRVDALSGATVSSRAALAAINRAVEVASQAAFGASPISASGVSDQRPAWLAPEFLLTLLLLLAFFPVYRSGRDGPRLLYQAAVLGILGFGLNTLVTEMDLVNLSLGHFSSPLDNPQRWLLLGFVLLTAILFGQAYCGYVCPFGALQEFISRLGRFLYLRSYPQQPLELRMRYIKFVLLALLLAAVWISGDKTWLAFNPMQHLFGGHFSGWLGAITVVSLVGALFYYRFWCRYFCPFGAFLALGNKLALWKSFAPQRRFEHCDIGVRHDYDVDCIHCHRCITARDFGVRHRRPPKAD